MTLLMFAILAVLAAFFLLGTGAAKAGKAAATDAGAAGVSAYKLQLFELEEDIAAGRVGMKEAAEMRHELERRLLQSARRYQRAAQAGAEPVDTGQKTASASDRRVSLLVAASVIAIGATLYGLLGSPLQPAVPGDKILVTEGHIEAGGPTYGQALARIKERIEERPDDIQAHIMLGRTARLIGDPHEAARAYQALVLLEPDNPNWQVERLSAFLTQSRGRMTPAARLVLADFLRLFPDHPYALYEQTRLLEEDGDTEAALALLYQLRENPAGPRMAQQIEIALARLTGDSSNLARAGQSMSEGAAAILQAMSGLSAQERQQMIGQMVSSLEERLQTDTGDIEGWLRLARSYTVLGDKRKAIQILEKAITYNPTDRSRLIEVLDSLNAKNDP